MTAVYAPFIVMASAGISRRNKNWRWEDTTNVAVVQIEVGAAPPKMVSERARGVVQVVKRWDNQLDPNRALMAACDLANALRDQHNPQR